jgi:hypothetical protein
MGQIEVQHEHDLAKVAPKDSVLYDELPLTSLTAYSLFWLHRWQLRRSIEAVAVLNWRLFPKKFAMVGFPEYPDAFRTNRSLLQGQPKYRNMLSGAASKGFSLNERGMDIARELVQLLGVPSNDDGQELGIATEQQIPAKSEGPPRSIEPEREMERVRASKLYEKWKSGVMADRDLIHVHALLRIFDHTPTKLRTKAIRELERMAADLHDEDALKFLQDVRQAFPQALVGKYD